MVSDASYKEKLRTEKMYNDLLKNDYKKAISFFDELDKDMLSNNINLSIEEMIDLINNNDQLREYIIIVFNYNIKDILSGDFTKFKNNEILTDLLSIYYMITNYNSYREIDDLNQEIDKLSPEMKEYYKYVRSIKKLDHKVELNLIKRIKQNDKEAKTILIESYLRVIFPIAYSFLNRTDKYTFEDLIQEASIALIGAAEHYDYSEGNSFYYYAKICIQYRLNKICNGNTKTRYICKKEEVLSNYKVDFILKNGRKPSIKEINEYMYSPSYDLEEDIVDKVFIEELKSTNILNEKYRRVLFLRYGLEDGKVYTLDEVGEILGITRQRVYKIELDALARLRYYLKDKKIEEESLPKEKEVKKRKRKETNNRIVVKRSGKLKINKSKTKEKDIYTLIFETLEKDENKKLLKIMFYEEALIFVLKNGLVNNKEYTCEEISRIINMDVLIVEKYYESSLEKYEKSKNKTLELVFRN
jgi:RNA polymerase primary sigma factor